jgi:hypothetical protein
MFLEQGQSGHMSFVAALTSFVGNQESNIAFKMKAY